MTKSVFDVFFLVFEKINLMPFVTKYLLDGERFRCCDTE